MQTRESQCRYTVNTEATAVMHWQQLYLTIRAHVYVLLWHKRYCKCYILVLSFDFFAHPFQIFMPSMTKAVLADMSSSQFQSNVKNSPEAWLFSSTSLKKNVYCMYSANLLSLHCCTLTAVQCDTGGLGPPLCPPGPWQGLMWVSVSGVVSAPTGPNLHLLALYLQLLHTKSDSDCFPLKSRWAEGFRSCHPRMCRWAGFFCFVFFLLLFMSYSLKRPLLHFSFQL